MNRAALARLTLSLMVFVSVALGQEANDAQEAQDATGTVNANAVYRVTGSVVDDVTGSPLSGVTGACRLCTCT